MHVRIEGREAGHGDVLGKDVELWYTVPSCTFGRKHVNQEDFGLDVLMIASFEDGRWLRSCQTQDSEGNQKLTGARNGTHVDNLLEGRLGIKIKERLDRKSCSQDWGRALGFIHVGGEKGEGRGEN